MAISANGIIATKDGSEEFLSQDNWIQFVNLAKKVGNFFVLNYFNKSLLWNAQNQTEQLDSNNQFEPNSTFLQSFKIPFEFTIPIPPPNLARVISERDEKGRILH